MMDSNGDSVSSVVNTQFTKILALSKTLGATFESEINVLNDNQGAKELLQNYKFSVKMLNNTIKECKKAVLDALNQSTKETQQSQPSQQQTVPSLDSQLILDVFDGLNQKLFNNIPSSIRESILSENNDEHLIKNAEDANITPTPSKTVSTTITHPDIAYLSSFRVNLSADINAQEQESKYKNDPEISESKSESEFNYENDSFVAPICIGDESFMLQDKSRRSRSNSFEDLECDEEKILMILPSEKQTLFPNIADNDKWDRNEFPKGLKIEGKKITSAKGALYLYGTKIVRRGIFRWRFRIEQAKTCGIMDIGVDPFGSKGYAFEPMRGRICVDINEYKEYGVECKIGDIVDMILDLEKLTLSYNINGIDYGKACDVEKGSYRAAVYLAYTGDSVSMLNDFD